MYAKLILAGYLGRDPEMRFTPAGQAVTNLNVATSRRWTDRDGNRQEETIWWRVAVWGKQAETCNQYLAKGRPVLIEGRVRPDPATGGPRIWTDRDGAARASYEVNALSVRFLGKGESRGDEPDGGYSGDGDLDPGELPF